MKTIIHVHPSTIEANRFPGNTSRPVFAIIDDNERRFASHVEICGPSRLMYSRDKTPHGISAWIETDGDVILD